MGSRVALDERNLEVSAERPRRLVHFSPLRYPGGKAKLSPFIKAVIELNDLGDGTYVEPFAGGAGIAIQLLLQGYVSQIEINDLSRPIYSFWTSVRDEGAKFADRIRNIELSIAEWQRQKAIFGSDQSGAFDLGFATFYLNRTNRSGVLNGGPIGGRGQTGNYLIDARFNRENLAYRIERIAALRKFIHISNEDALIFVKRCKKKLPKESLIYADPPYFRKGSQLYYDFFVERDHRRNCRIFC